MSKNQTSPDAAGSILQANPDSGLPLSAEDLKATYPDYKFQIQHTQTQPAKDADTVPANDVLREELAESLPHDLYTHQADALRALEQGENVCVATSTSSGKTLVYALQAARNHIQSNGDATGLLIYPTKALSRDQEQSLNNLYADLGLDINVQVYDGDTKDNRRKRIRANADLIITNFSGLNVYLHDHTRWTDIFNNVELFAVDESHSYTGVQGMHVAWTIRRARRIFEYYNSDPQFVMTSATIGNPAQHSKALTGKDVKVIDNDGSPRGQHEVVFWDPPGYADEDDYGKKPADQEASEVVAHLAQQDVQTLMFTKSRKQTELNAERVRAAAQSHVAPGGIDVTSYNGGHGKKTRRSAEHKLKEGNLDAVVSTNALELGIDIGSVDATVITRYPGTKQSFWQQLGRAGRGQSDALGVLVPGQNNIDQYILDNPDYLFGDDVESAVVDLENNPVYSKHVLCAANELALTKSDKKWFGGHRLEQAVEMYRKAGALVGKLSHGVQYEGKRRPQRDISMYATSDEQFKVRSTDDSLDVEPIDKERAYRDFHPGAIYLHKGSRYEVTELREDVPKPYVKLKPVDVDYYTRTLSDTEITDLETLQSRDLGRGIKLHWGKGKVNVHYYAYQQVDVKTGESNGPERRTGLDPIEMHTQLMWVDVPDTKLGKLLEDRYKGEDTFDSDKRLLGALHAIEHGMIGMAPLEFRLSKKDLGGLSVSGHPELNGAGFFIYDGIPGGLGFSRSLYNEFETVAERTHERLNECACNSLNGCPACTMDDDCGDNEPLHRPGAADIVKIITGLANN
ncbi:DEAD/DEAH box helicase [Salinibaculum rarum]|uniref:DEAD/DEAH box helicase n=1 Tax=Salinibaculum rarum TaxID=3058903 RepID=UPI00265F0BA8|nr:DEAD/DEAH box helicase [Salinibaculum sp. KK48]